MCISGGRQSTNWQALQTHLETQLHAYQAPGLIIAHSVATSKGPPPVSRSASLGGQLAQATAIKTLGHNTQQGQFHQCRATGSYPGDLKFSVKHCFHTMWKCCLQAELFEVWKQTAEGKHGSKGFCRHMPQAPVGWGFVQRRHVRQDQSCELGGCC